MPFALGQLFAVPLQSALRAQSLVAQEALSVFESLGFQDGKARTFRFRAERMIEERYVDPATGVAEIRPRVEPFEVSIPILALLPLSTLHLQELTAEFGVEVVAVKARPIKTIAFEAVAQGPSMADSQAVFSTANLSSAPTMKVTMKIVKDTPEGLSRVVDLLADLLSGSSGSKARSIDELRGPTKRHVALLAEKGLTTVSAFVKATASPRSRVELARALGVAPEEITEWRRAARALPQEEPED